MLFVRTQIDQIADISSLVQFRVTLRMIVGSSVLRLTAHVMLRVAHWLALGQVLVLPELLWTIAAIVAG